MSEDDAVMAGYTREVHLTSDTINLYLLVKPDVDLDERFRAWEMAKQKFIHINGELFSVIYDEGA